MWTMDAEAAAGEFAELFGRAYRRFYRRVPVDQYRLTAESIAVLQHLVDAGPVTIAEAAAHLRRSQSAMSEMVDRLERRDLIARVADQRDRRRTLVWLTETGHEALGEAQRVLSTTRLRQAFTALDDEERNGLVDALRRLIETPVHRQGHEQDRSEQA
jgi:DNA-binding MarR family transcriptional regulator